MADQFLEEVQVPKLLHVTLRISRALAAAPVRLRRARTRWLLAVSPRQARIQRLLACVICAVTLSVAVITTIKGNVRTSRISGVFSLNSYIGHTERNLMLLAFMIGLLTAPGRVKRIVSQLQQLQQINYYVDECGISSTIKTQRLNFTFLNGYLIWQIFIQAENIIFLLLGTVSDKFASGFHSISLFYQNFIVLLLELQWILVVVEINLAIVKLNDKIEHQLKNIALIHSLDTNFIPREFPRCFEVICDLVTQKDKEDGLFVLLTLIILFLRMLITIIDLISTIITLPPDIAMQWFYIVRETALCVTIFLELLVYVEPCHWTQFELERTFILLKKISREVNRITGQASAEVDQFLLVAQMRNAKFFPMGVFRIARSLITSIIGSLVTYLVIIIQMQSIK